MDGGFSVSMSQIELLEWRKSDTLDIFSPASDNPQRISSGASSLKEMCGMVTFVVLLGVQSGNRAAVARAFRS